MNFKETNIPFKRIKKFSISTTDGFKSILKINKNIIILLYINFHYYKNIQIAINNHINFMEKSLD
ncbi:hypothetical protein [Borrelia parkeri]|nr:hypothetical protein [Borrelia parkeri]AHE63171.1 hypothetical protein X966_03770 [Borrelia parkeri HR1]UPA10867.1 hypothetical protein bpSLO_000742 [Borrelia parkeri]